ncbi:TolC family protein [Niabella hibiscisoli]|uniref:TolC family protein n=1 Tax=Niabella hibiscisoli TaxID=1825928 RepID=UPI001F1005A4|nr:TolC family protein [Niabella hibiscisoli]MCH5721321.1 TolC family protein [Niabella hibiscisoli]
MFKKNLKPLLLSLVMSIVAGSAMAQTGEVLTLKAALNYAVQNYTDARKSRLDLENAQYKVDEVRSRALPQISGSGQLNYNPLLQQSVLPGALNPANPGQDMLIAFGQKWNANIGVSLTQNLFDQSVFAGLKAAKTTKEFYTLNNQLTEEQVLEQVATSYYQVFVQRQQIANVDSNISTTQKAFNIIKGQFESGLGKQIDVDRVTVQLANLQSQRQQLTNAVTQYENQLKFYIGMPVTQSVAIEDPEQLDITVFQLDLPDSLNANNRTEIRVLDKQEELLVHQKKSIVAEYYPTLSLTSNYSYQSLSNRFPIAAGRYGNAFDVAAIGLNLKIPIFNGHATKARINQANVELKRLQEDRIKTKNSLDLAYENAKTQIRNNIIILNNQKVNVELAQKVLDNTRSNYQLGLAPLTDLLDAQNALSEAQNNHVAATLNYRVAEIQLIKSKGLLKTLMN